MPRFRLGPFPPPTPERINHLPKTGTGISASSDTFVGAEELREIFLLRDQNRALVKLVAEMEAGNRWQQCQNGDSVRG
jgi:hypothetical protein